MTDNFAEQVGVKVGARVPSEPGGQHPARQARAQVGQGGGTCTTRVRVNNANTSFLFYKESKEGFEIAKCKYSFFKRIKAEEAKLQRSLLCKGFLAIKVYAV